MPFLMLPEQILFNAMLPVLIQKVGSPYLDSDIADEPVF